MLIKVDEDLPADVARRLVAEDHDAETVLEKGMGGWKDDALWDAVGRESRLLVTTDKGFGDISRYPPGTHPGILLLRPDEDGIEPLLVLLRSVLALHNLESLANCVSVAAPRGLRVRRP